MLLETETQGVLLVYDLPSTPWFCGILAKATATSRVFELRAAASSLEVLVSSSCELGAEGSIYPMEIGWLLDMIAKPSHDLYDGIHASKHFVRWASVELVVYITYTLPMTA